ncbi:sugar transferase [Sphingomonas phyllosphaerae]|uniref:sugar transferase n=1 Tax=Sphingomonas phyllosphaerae TaxID=257003 RepID=UPI0003F919E5|nr:sugar transferase [Sphingomonas phyllosphaerae]
MSLKRAIDIAGALTGLVCLSPVIAATAVAIRITMGSPVFFRQARPGLGGRPFTMIKFRTMANAHDAAGRPLPDSQRLTRIGRLLRSTSLDELPELWNVLVGDMSLVGPRPLLTAYLDRYSPDQARRHDVKPGVTGWAQINGRNAISWDEKFALDLWYVDHRSTLLDLRILFATVRQVVWRKGINSSEAATMPEFTGNNPLD